MAGRLGLDIHVKRPDRDVVIIKGYVYCEGCETNRALNTPFKIVVAPEARPYILYIENTAFAEGLLLFAALLLRRGNMARKAVNKLSKIATKVARDGSIEEVYALMGFVGGMVDRVAPDYPLEEEINTLLNDIYNMLDVTYNAYAAVQRWPEGNSYHVAYLIAQIIDSALDIDYIRCELPFEKGIEVLF